MSRQYLISNAVNKIESFKGLITGNHDEMSLLPILNSPYRISDIVTDFNQMSWNLEKISSFRKKSIIHFDRTPSYAVNHVKLYIVFEIHRGCKGSTLLNKISILNKMFRTVNKIHPNITDLSQISLDDLLQAERNNKPGKIIAEFFYLMVDLGAVNLSFDVIDYDNELSRRKKTSSYQLIPQDLFKRILAVTEQVMDDENAPIDDRIMACSIRLFTQIAPRISEFLHFTVNQDIYHHVPDKGNILYFQYNVTKTESGSGKRIVEVPLNTIAEKAYKKLIELRKNVKCCKTSDILFSYCDDKTLPVNESTFRNRYIDFFMTYLPNEIQETYENFDGIRYGDKQYSIPMIHSYRVNVVTELYCNRIGLDYIRRRMSHLSYLSEATYTRPALPSAGEAEFVDMQLKKEKERLEANNPENNIDVNQIKDFLNNNRPKVIKMTSSELLNLMSSSQYNPVREGICTKGLEFILSKIHNPTILTAEDEKDYDQLLLDLVEFRNKRESFSLQIKHKQYAEENIQKLELARLSNRILIVLNNLKKECRAVGVDNFIFDKPDLEDIVLNIDVIIDEIKKWR